MDTSDAMTLTGKNRIYYRFSNQVRDFIESHILQKTPGSPYFTKLGPKGNHLCDKQLNKNIYYVYYKMCAL